MGSILVGRSYESGNIISMTHSGRLLVPQHRELTLYSKQIFQDSDGRVYVIHGATIDLTTHVVMSRMYWSGRLVEIELSVDSEYIQESVETSSGTLTFDMRSIIFTAHMEIIPNSDD